MEGPEDEKTDVIETLGECVNINLNDDSSALSERLTALEARVTALEAANTVANTDIVDPISNTDLEESDIADVDEAATTQISDEELVEDTYGDDEDIINLRQNLKSCELSIERRFNLAEFVATKTGQKVPETLKDANSLMTLFRHIYASARRVNTGATADVSWGDAPATRNNSRANLTNHERLMAAKFGGKK